MTQPTQSIIKIIMREKHGEGFKVVKTATHTVDVTPAYMEAWINIDDWKEGTVPADYESYTFDGQQTFTYLANDYESFYHRNDWAQYSLKRELPTHEYMTAQVEQDREMFISLGLSTEPTVDELVALAESSHTTPQVLALLSKTRHSKVAWAILENPNTSLETLVTLSDSNQHYGIRHWGYNYDGVGMDAMSAVDERFPGFDWDEEDDQPRALVLSAWVYRNHAVHYNGDTLAFALSAMFITESFNEATKDITVEVPKIASRMCLTETQVVQKLEAIGAATDDNGNKLWNVKFDKPAGTGVRYALLQPLFADKAVWVPPYTLSELQAQEEWKRSKE